MQERPLHSPDPGAPDIRRRRLRAVFAADMANFGGMVSIEETRTLDSVWFTRQIATEELAKHGGWLFGLPGDGIFALFESAVDAVRCALQIQTKLRDAPKVHALKLRIGVHLGEVLFQDELPFGETLVMASRLEGLAEPGGILVSAAVLDAVASHIVATFSESGVPGWSTARGASKLSECPPLRRRASRARAELLDRTVAPGPAIARESKTSIAAATPDQPHAIPVAQAPRDEPTPSRAVATSPLLAACVDDASLRQLTLLLTPHIGPMARLLVRRKAADNRDADHLILVLADEIPSEGERRMFVAQARASIAGVGEI